MTIAICVLEQPSEVMETPVANFLGSFPAYGQRMIERAPPKLRTTPGSNIIRHVPLRARPFCIDCDLESRLRSSEQHEHI